MALRKYWAGWPCLGVVLCLAATTGAQTPHSDNLRSLAELQSSVAQYGNAVRSFQLEAVVCAVVPERQMLALHDATATLLLKLPALPAAISVGDRLSMSGTNCLIARDRYGLRITAVVVDNDRRHHALLKSGSVYLPSGPQPLEVEWFNGLADSALNLEYAGPGVPRQRVPAAALCRKEAASAADFRPGLDFATYNGDWDVLPDFAELTPVTHGVATNFSLAYAAQQEHTALVFNGFIQILNAGIYTFYLTSDDGSRLTLGHPEVACTVVAGTGRAEPAPKSFTQALMERDRSGWVEFDGEAAFAGEDQHNLQMQMMQGENRLSVTVLDGAPLLATNLLQARIQVAGICELPPLGGQRKDAELVVPSMAQVKILSRAGERERNYSTNDWLTTVAQVRRLKPEQANRGLRVEITGVVIASSAVSLVLQDGTGGVFVTYAAGDSFGQPAQGQRWKIRGRTSPGDFSPVVYSDAGQFLGNAGMPEPIRPRHDQLMNGSLDSQFVELHGVVTALSDTEMTLLTPEGKVTIRGTDERPLPQASATTLAGGSLAGNVVRMRGCFTANYNRQTGVVIGGAFNFHPAAVELEETTPQDPFSVAASKASDLLRFNDAASSLQRIKLAGQVIHARAGECFLLDGQTGVRVLMAETVPLRAGDLIEAVGFPQYEGSGLVLQAARVRETGRAPLPQPVKVSEDDLFNEQHNATLVQVQALVISDAQQLDRRVLELQAGPRHFLATFKLKGEVPVPVSPGSRVQLTGVYASAREDLAGNRLEPFELLLNSAGDIVVLQQPPWWTVRRAVAMAGLLAGGLGATMIWILQLRRKVEERTAQLQREIEERQRVEQHRLMEQERTRVAQDLHDELGAGLTQVGLLGSLAKNPALTAERKTQYLDQLSESARRLVTGLDEIVWAINPKYDSIASLASYFALFTQRFLNLAGIACRFDPAENVSDYPLDSRLRHGIFLAFKEAINNVVRHSGATEVWLRIAVDRNQLMISITDNGCGFAASPDAPGSDGLTGMRQRMARLGGQCVIHSQPGKGATVKLNLPLARNGA